MKYKVLNNVTGWLMFAVSLTVYMMTLEPSVSLWDCGEFISASYKLQVVHPPGAPFFLMLGRFFTMFAGAPEQVAFAVNTMSAVMSALTVLFTFWITTHFARKIMVGNNAETNNSTAMVIGSGLVAALALTFSDSFWFSAVEGEVYAMSSAFTALTFWAMLKWEESNSRYADKWIVLISYLIGLAIGTHLLNLLVIPAIVFIYYFKKYSTVTKLGLASAFGVGLLILGFIQKGVISKIPQLMAYMDKFFVNDLGMGFGTGVIFAMLLIVALICFGIFYTQKHRYRAWNLGFVCLSYILLGYSSYAMVVVRSQDNPPIDMNNPEEPFNLLSYINREQYGDRPLAYGPYFNAAAVEQIEGSPTYTKDSASYKFLGYKTDYKFDPQYSTVFPRMGDMQKDNGDVGYRYWSSNSLSNVQEQIDQKSQELQAVKDPKERERIAQEIEELKRVKPSMFDNLSFLFRYQLGHMYFRYFMWNFAGRQNDNQAMFPGDYQEGNWISGIGFIDNWRLGTQKNLPDYLKDNQAKNKYYFLPLILGILGLVFHFKRGRNDAIVTTVLFVFTGILIIIYLNQPPFEPRERDYSMVGSFQTFCIWIGLGVLFIADKLQKKMNMRSAGILATVIALSAPVVMAKDGWDDHDRSGRRLGIDFAYNYLHSCAENAVLFTNGDNDTYPLWYAQNVEGIRTDVRVINMSLLPTDWYSQVLKDKVYKSDPLPLTLTKKDLAAGNLDYFPYKESLDPKKYYPLREVLNEVKKNRVLPTRNFRIPITPENKRQIIANKVVPEADYDKIADEIRFSIPASSNVMKSTLVLLDLIATNAEQGWPRPIYFTSTSGSDGFHNLEPYFQNEGLTYRLVPIHSPGSRRGRPERLAEDILYDRLMNKFRYSNMKEKEHFFLDDKATLVPATLQSYFINIADIYTERYKLATAEIKNNDTALAKNSPGSEALALRNDSLKKQSAEWHDKALALLKKGEDVIPDAVSPTREPMEEAMVTIYYDLGDKASSERHLKKLYEKARQKVAYFSQIKDRKQFNGKYMQETMEALEYMKRAVGHALRYNLNDLAKTWQKEYEDYSKTFNM